MITRKNIKSATINRHEKSLQSKKAKHREVMVKLYKMNFVIPNYKFLLLIIMNS